MSKSLGNVIVPQKVIKVMGADILRLWVAADRLPRGDEHFRRDSHAHGRFLPAYPQYHALLLASLSGFETSALLPAKDMLALDQWALQRAHDLQKEILQAYEEFQFHLIYQKLHQFWRGGHGGFYLDVLKDRMYTMPANSRGRRSAQTAMFHILEALVRWLAPVLTFTAEEIWRHKPGKRSESVFLEAVACIASAPERELDMAFWNEVIAVRQAWPRNWKSCAWPVASGSGLDAEVNLYGDDSWQEKLRRLGDELRFVFITSYARVHGLDKKPSSAVETEIKVLYVRVAPSAYPKCIRCWHHREDVGANQEHPQICGRCVQNVTGPRRNQELRLMWRAFVDRCCCLRLRSTDEVCGNRLFDAHGDVQLTSFLNFSLVHNTGAAFGFLKLRLRMAEHFFIIVASLRLHCYFVDDTAPDDK